MLPLLPCCLQESSAYDAFETTLEILRMRVAHPGADPATYASLDPAYAAFMECRGAPAVATVLEGAVHTPGAGQRNAGEGAAAGKDSDVHGAPQAAEGAAEAVSSLTGTTGVKRSRRYKSKVKHAPGLCSLSWLDGEPPPCYFCQDPHEQMVPGGAACCWAENLSVCPRVWT
jgi:hypothetical protein